MVVGKRMKSGCTQFALTYYELTLLGSSFVNGLGVSLCFFCARNYAARFLIPDRSTLKLLEQLASKLKKGAIAREPATLSYTLLVSL